MERKCLNCEHPFNAEFDTDVFCSTYCQNDWWVTPDASARWESLEYFAKLTWSQAH